MSFPAEVRRREVVLAKYGLAGFVAIPSGARGAVIFAHGSGSSRFSPRNQMVGAHLNEAGIATLLFDLLTDIESADRRNVFNVSLLAARLREATAWARAQADIPKPLGYFGASTGGAAAILAAAAEGERISAIVSRGGRPDLAPLEALQSITAPTLLIVGERDVEVLALNRFALAEMKCEAELSIVPNATHLFEEEGALERVAELAKDWFLKYFHSGGGAGGRISS